jgi:hypothetical protein
MFTGLQRKMIGHGAVILLIGMCAGIGLLMSLLGGVELIPGSIVPLEVPGETDAWVRAHIGGMMNAFLIILVAVLISGLGFADKAAGRLGWMLIGTGWANTLFYWAALFAPNRAISFATNKFGPSNLASIVGLAPALAFAIISLIAVFMVARQALASTGR